MTDPLGLIGPNAPIHGPQPNPAARPGGRPAGPSFKDVLMKNIQQVNDLQQEAERAIEDLSAGRRDDVANVMIAKQKADLAFKMLLQVRNKMVEAYDEVKQLRV